MTKPLTNGNGCGYGRGTRWAMGSVLTLIVLVIGIGITMTRGTAAESDIADHALDMEITKNTELIYTNEAHNSEAIGRIDEKLNYVVTTQERILVILEK